jgi:hypothetical protein
MLTVNVTASNYTVGVKVGDWAKYEDNEVYWGWVLEFQGPVKNITQFVEVKVLSIEGTNITSALTIELQNGTQTRESTLTTDAATGEIVSPLHWSLNWLSASEFFIPANYTVGESVLGGSMNISSESVGTYAGANRTIVTSHSGGGYYHWDKRTGALVEFFCMGLNPNASSLLYQNENQTFKLMETNMWSSTGVNWFPLIIALLASVVVIAVAILISVVKRKRYVTTPPQEQAQHTNARAHDS